MSNSCDPVDCSLPGSSVHGIIQERILEWVAISFSRESSYPGIEPRSPALQAYSLLTAIKCNLTIFLKLVIIFLVQKLFNKCLRCLLNLLKPESFQKQSFVWTFHNPLIITSLPTIILIVLILWLTYSVKFGVMCEHMAAF